jgi:hypothetical protein
MGIHVAPALGASWLREGPQRIGWVAAILAGVGIPLAAHRLVPLTDVSALPLVAGACIAGGVLARLHGRVEGWKIAGAVLVALVLFSVTR